MLEQHIFTSTTAEEFETLAIKVFQYQYKYVSVYRKFCNLLGVTPSEVKKIKDIPFLPIQLFKEQVILSSQAETRHIFTSSGTTGAITSKHHIASLSLYEQSFTRAFQEFYGDPSDYTILALLPSYLERGGSSLVYMAEVLIQKSKQPDSGFYLNNYNALLETLKALEVRKQKTLLIGVSYALLDLIEKEQLSLAHAIVMETGGMKGRRKEMIKEELHRTLQKGFGVAHIHSEYGMTELLSQAYSQQNGIFKCPPWMSVLTRDPGDALTFVEGKTGGINVIDLANLYSCSFIATQDLGTLFPDGSFKILGRFDNSDIRGCNLMIL